MDGERGQHCPLQPVACSTHPRAWGACITAPTSLHSRNVPRGVGICSHLGFGSEFRHGCRAKATSGEHSPKQCWGCRGGCHGTHRHGAPQAVGCCKALLQLSVWCCYLGSSCSFGLFFFFPANAAALLLLSCHAPGQTNMHAGRHACTRVCALRAARPVFDAHHPGQQHSPHHPLHCSPLLCIEAAGADARRLSMVWASCQPQLGAVTREP